ncbi:hypothetical protein [Lactobacillus crispatus]|uniref:hypothetical protein n=1 Tax=Lactobacillus crispatus TaxID=47770 RepID=UPI00336AD55B
MVTSNVVVRISSGQQSDGSFVATQADIDQATEIGKNYLIEHRYGHMQVQTSLDYQDMSDNDQDFTQLSLYDYVDVSFPDYEIIEKAEVTATTWDCLAHVFLNVTLGDLPTSYEHLLVQASEDRTNEKSLPHVKPLPDQIVLLVLFRKL